MNPAKTMSINKIVFLIVCLVLSSRCLALGEFVVSGVASFGQANPKFAPMRFNLTLESSGNEYRITTKAIAGEWYNDEVTSGDGTNNYFLDKTWPSWEARRNHQGYRETGTVINGDFPANSLSIVQLMWLVYCSGSHFHPGTNHVDIPLRCTRYSSAKELTQVVSYAKSTPNIINEIKCYSQGLLSMSGGRKVKLSPPYDKGFLLWQLKVIDYTNIGGLNLPRAFRYAQYIPNDTKQGNQLAYIIKAKFDVTNTLKKASSIDLLPVTTTQNVRVFDWRFNRNRVPMESGKKGTPVATYEMKDGHWRTPDDPSIKEQIVAIQRIVHGRQLANTNPVIKWLIFTAFSASTLLFGWFVVREINGNKQKKKG